MLYLFYGDKTKGKEKVSKLIDDFKKKRPESDVYRISPENFDEANLDDLIGGQMLFADKFLVICDGIAGGENSRGFIFEKLKDISASKNFFFFIEEELEENDLEKIKKNAEKAFEFKKDLQVKKYAGFNIFSISDALGEKDKKKLWILLNKAEKEGVSAEEVFWKLVWQVKNMLLGKTAEEKGDRAVEKLKMSPFVLGKAKRYSKKFSKSELLGLYGDLVRLYHDGRRRVGDFNILVEKFILNLP